LNEALERRRHERPAVDVEKLDRQRPEAQVIPFPHSASSSDPEKTMAQRQISSK
jgi:RNA polymerase sigma-70 factor (ECF subfamily)